MTQKYTQWGLGVKEAWWGRVLAGPTGHLGKPLLASGRCFLSHENKQLELRSEIYFPQISSYGLQGNEHLRSQSTFFSSFFLHFSSL